MSSSIWVGHAEVAAIAVPDLFGDFDHQALAAEIAADVPTARHVLVVGDDVRNGHEDLRALLGAPEEADEARRRLDADALSSRDVAVFLLSGGTTGLPSFIPRTHDDYEYNASQRRDMRPQRSRCVPRRASPQGHNFPLACPGIVGTFMVGARVVLARRRRFRRRSPQSSAKG